jgi:hypothetical protein
MSASVTDINAARSPLSYALQYIRLGLWVLPLEPGSKKPLGRLVRNGFHDATNDAKVVNQWWSQYPAAGIGIAVKRSGWVVVDIDPRNGGIETIDALEAKHGALQSDVLAYTGGGGEHRVFAAQLVEALPGKLGPGVDLKADGYIAVEPTLHPSGKSYAWEASSDPLDGVVPSTLPGWIRDLGRAAPAVSSHTPPTVPPIAPARLASAREALAVIDSDDRETWVTVGAAIQNEMPTQEGFSLWDAWSQGSPKYDPQDAIRVWRSFKVKGLSGVGLNTVFAMAQKAGWKNTGGLTAATPLPVDTSELPLVFAETIDGNHIAVAQLVEDVLTQGGLSVIYGESNSGKSFMACDMACSVAVGTPWLGKRTVQGAVLYVAGEGAESIKLRVLAWRQKHNADPKLAVVPVAVNLLKADADARRVVQACKAVQAHYGMAVTLIIIDTLARAFAGGNENASEDMSAVISHADLIRAETGAHVVFIHHSGKDSAKGSRGHSSLKAATDTEIEVTAEEATKLHTAEIRKQRDLGSRGDKIVAKFSVVKMGMVDQWGKPVTTCVVDPTDEKPAGKPKRERGSELEVAMCAVLRQAPNHTMKRSELVKELERQGFNSSPIYRAFERLSGGKDGNGPRMLEESMGRIHLLNIAAAMLVGPDKE